MGAKRLTRVAKARLRERRLVVIDRAQFRARRAAAFNDLPPCAQSMGCLCAAHARGAAATEACNATE